MRWVAITVLTLGLAACGDDDGSSRDVFEQGWHEAVNNRQPDQLYHLLDSVSRRKIDTMLETLRGFDKNRQRVVIDFLGGKRISNLHEITPDEFFGLWWDKATNGKQPTMTIDAAGDTQAGMTLRLGGKSQKILITRESGRWVWRLPAANFDLKRQATGKADKVPSLARPD